MGWVPPRPPPSQLRPVATVWEDCIGCGAPPEHNESCSYCKRARRLLPAPYRPQQPGTTSMWVGEGKPVPVKKVTREMVRRANDKMIAQGKQRCTRFVVNPIDRDDPQCDNCGWNESHHQPYRPPQPSGYRTESSGPK